MSKALIHQSTYIPPGQGLFAALSSKLCPKKLHPEISFKYLKACTSMEADMSHVKDFVSIHLPTDTFYVGATVRSPEERWVLKADDRSQPSHCDVYSDMYVLLSGHAASIAEREVALIRFFSWKANKAANVSTRRHTREDIPGTPTRLFYIFVGIQGGLVLRVTQCGSVQKILIQLLDS